MSTVNRSGGDWTEEKLRRLKKYLAAYTIIFNRNPRAKFFLTHYVDAFAGSGSRVTPMSQGSVEQCLFDEQELPTLDSFYKGSAQIALEVEPAFDYYLFIEQNPAYVQALESLRHDHPTKASRIDIRHGDANTILQDWCGRLDWSRNRSVVFLDPYGMAVNWVTIEELGKTKAVDLWILLPVGQAINRLLTRRSIPTGAWADRLTTFFGSDSWKEAFYRPRLQSSLFEDDVSYEKQADFETIGDYFAERLGEAFPYVADRSLMLLNSRNIPIFVLYFATANATAVNIAEDILGK